MSNDFHILADSTINAPVEYPTSIFSNIPTRKSSLSYSLHQLSANESFAKVGPGWRLAGATDRQKSLKLIFIIITVSAFVCNIRLSMQVWFGDLIKILGFGLF